VHTTDTARRTTLTAEATAALALQVWLARRLARATEHASARENADLLVPAQRAG
jgi:hypothetical protein